MRQGLLSALAFAVLFFVACGGGGSTDGSEAEGKPFRIPFGNPPIRYASEMKPGKAGLVGVEPKPIIPSSSPPDFLALVDVIEGIGPLALPGSELTVQYVGVDYATGEKFDSSWEQGRPFTFVLGAGEVIEGWEQGINGMEVGDRRELVIPPDLAYGEEGNRSVAPNSTLVFVIDLIAVKG